MRADRPGGNGSRSFLNTVRDVTELRAHEAALRQHAERLANIADVVREIGHCDPLDARPTICRTALALADGAHTACLWEKGRDGVLTTTAVRPDVTAPYRIDAEDREHGARVAMESGQPLFVADAESSRTATVGCWRARAPGRSSSTRSRTRAACAGCWRSPGRSRARRSTTAT